MATGFADPMEVISAIDALAKEKKINKDVLYAKIESALVSAYKRSFGKVDKVRAVIDRTTGTIEVLAHKKIVDEVTDPTIEISLDEVREVIRNSFELKTFSPDPAMAAKFAAVADKFAAVTA